VRKTDWKVFKIPAVLFACNWCGKPTGKFSKFQQFCFFENCNQFWVFHPPLPDALADDKMNRVKELKGKDSKNTTIKTDTSTKPTAKV